MAGYDTVSALVETENRSLCAFIDPMPDRADRRDDGRGCTAGKPYRSPSREMGPGHKTQDVLKKTSVVQRGLRFI